MIKLLIVLFAIIQIAVPTKSPASIFEGFGAEIGIGMNNLFWSAPFSIKTLGGVAADRTNISIAYNIRINYHADITESFVLLPFIGYNQIGGSGDTDKYSFDTLEFGAFFLWKISNLSVGIGGKNNSHQGADYYYPSTIIEDRSEWFKDRSIDLGFRASYLFEPITLGVETWFGLSNIATGALTGASIHQNHMRFLIGYTF